MRSTTVRSLSILFVVIGAVAFGTSVPALARRHGKDRRADCARVAGTASGGQAAERQDRSIGLPPGGECHDRGLPCSGSARDGAGAPPGPDPDRGPASRARSLEALDAPLDDTIVDLAVLIDAR
jgi:hypothetical protein